MSKKPPATREPAANPGTGYRSTADMSRDEQRLLIYLEACSVDFGGRVESQRVNAEEFEILEAWKSSGFVQFGRIRYGQIRAGHTHWVILTEQARGLAVQLRAERAARGLENLRQDFEGVPA